MPTVSVIIPVYNCERWLHAALDSCLNQSVTPTEIVIVDDGSTDRSPEIMAHYAAHSRVPILVTRSANRGASSARNLGIEIATGEFLLFLDADDVLAPNAISSLGSSAGAAEAVFGRHCNLDETGGIETPCLKTLMYSDAYANIVRNTWFQGAAIVRKTDLRWNEGRTIWEGMEYMLDFLAPGRPAVFIEERVVGARQHHCEHRISNRFDHFEPAMTGAFFAAQKAKLENAGQLNPERCSALDFFIIGNAYALLRQGRSAEADALFAQISWIDVVNHDWHRRGSLAWAARLFGPRIGSRAFFYANKILGRA